jgi:hypothetical protein
MQMHNQEGS